MQGFSEICEGEKSINVSPDTAGGVGGLDSMAGSLEDLVSTFDEKLTMCFADYEEQVEKIAPVQVGKKHLRDWDLDFLIFKYLKDNTKKWRYYSKNKNMHMQMKFPVPVQCSYK